MPLGRAIVWNKLVPKGSVTAFSARRSRQVLPMCFDSNRGRLVAMAGVNPPGGSYIGTLGKGRSV
jgi:hypothetical protein